MSQSISDFRTEKNESNASIGTPPRLPAGSRGHHDSIRARARLHLCNSFPVQLVQGRIVRRPRMETRMRLAVAVGSLFAIWTAVAAADETWKEYDYSDLGFAVAFPADPTVEMLPYKASDGSVATEIRYSVREGAD